MRLPNGRDQAGRGKGVQHGTERRTRPCLHRACSALGSSWKIRPDSQNHLEGCLHPGASAIRKSATMLPCHLFHCLTQFPNQFRTCSPRHLVNQEMQALGISTQTVRAQGHDEFVERNVRYDRATHGYGAERNCLVARRPRSMIWNRKPIGASTGAGSLSSGLEFCRVFKVVISTAIVIIGFPHRGQIRRFLPRRTAEIQSSAPNPGKS
jgi:hypothetical protein